MHRHPHYSVMRYLSRERLCSMEISNIASFHDVEWLVACAEDCLVLWLLWVLRIIGDQQGYQHWRQYRRMWTEVAYSDEKAHCPARCHLFDGNRCCLNHQTQNYRPGSLYCGNCASLSSLVVCDLRIYVDWFWNLQRRHFQWSCVIRVCWSMPGCLIQQN